MVSVAPATPNSPYLNHLRDRSTPPTIQERHSTCLLLSLLLGWFTKYRPGYFLLVTWLLLFSTWLLFSSPPSIDNRTHLIVETRTRRRRRRVWDPGISSAARGTKYELGRVGVGTVIPDAEAEHTVQPCHSVIFPNTHAHSYSYNQYKHSRVSDPRTDTRYQSRQYSSTSPQPRSINYKHPIHSSLSSVLKTSCCGRVDESLKSITSAVFDPTEPLHRSVQSLKVPRHTIIESNYFWGLVNFPTTYIFQAFGPFQFVYTGYSVDAAKASLPFHILNSTPTAKHLGKFTPASAAKYTVESVKSLNPNPRSYQAYLLRHKHTVESLNLNSNPTTVAVNSNCYPEFRPWHEPC